MTILNLNANDCQIHIYKPKGLKRRGHVLPLAPLLPLLRASYNKSYVSPPPNTAPAQN